MQDSEDQEPDKGKIIEEYYNMKMKQALEPLYQNFQKWDKGEIDHSEISEAIHECQKEIQKIHSIFNSGTDFLMKLIEANDDMPYDREGNRTD
ncbi:hypothetical protein AKJ41_04045 [candidate division MSBL1 archaeon SCGC-AAA259O05]|uniref:Uncharacterized protein n=1 Tax=candidate division MSBL1 archaeon SCGC-AAA259O05 TaxID=1698271 RepID=A0A133V1Y6_9EURY|nr:hypothetical protein AKJ41_04045 [candidate division MSBL1 archaeon SCGC-AAA259O05]